MKGKKLDLSVGRPAETASTGEPSGRFLGVNFACCGVYSRVYPNRQNTAYEGRCPRCARPIRFAIGPGGTASRFFTAS